MKYYLEDTINQLIEEALLIRGNINSEFDKGKLFGYYETLSKLLNQADAFGVCDEVPLKCWDFNPEDLLNKIEGLPISDEKKE